MRMREKKCDENDALERRKEELCWAVRQRKAGRAGAREVLELERNVSCRCGDLWRGTKLKVGSGQPLDDLHRSAALGAAIQGAGIFWGRGG